MNKSNIHKSVLLNEVIEALKIKTNGVYVDCTLGRCGHSLEIIKNLGPNGKLIGIDCDQEAIDWAEKTMQSFSNFNLIKNHFDKLDEILHDLSIDEIDGCLFDLGVSSPQLDNYDRGFSYHNDAKLDMRMDQSQSLSAYEVVNEYELSKLTQIFKEYGQSPFSYNVAKAIVNARQKKPISNNLELVNIIKNALPQKKLHDKKHPAKIFFQAIRIEVNNEKQQIFKGIESAIKHLGLNSRVVIITFHSLESRWVNQAIRLCTQKNKLPSYLPIQQVNQFKIIKTKPVSVEEIEQNKRAKSAKLYIIERSK